MDKSTHEKHLSQPLQTNNKQFKTAITFLTGYNGNFNVTNFNSKFCFKKSFDVGISLRITIPPGAYEIESLNDEIKRIIIDKGHYNENNYPFTIKASFSTFGSIIEISQTGPIISFVMEDSIRILLGFGQTNLYNEYNLSPNPVDILSFDNIFIECDIAQGFIFKDRRIGITHNFTMDVSPGYKYLENVSGCISWYIMQSKDFISSICFSLKNENDQIVPFNGESSISFRVSIKKI